MFCSTKTRKPLEKQWQIKIRWLCRTHASKQKTPLKHCKVDLHVAFTNTLRIPQARVWTNKQTRPFQPVSFASVTAFHSWSNYFYTESRQWETSLFQKLNIPFQNTRTLLLFYMEASICHSLLDCQWKLLNFIVPVRIKLYLHRDFLSVYRQENTGEF